MAYSSHYHLLFFCSTFLPFFIYPSIEAVTFPTALILLVTKDQSTMQYITQIYQRTPLVPVKLAIDLGGPFLWVNCNPDSYVSSTYKPVYCNSTECALTQSRTCINDTCALLTDNRVVDDANSGLVSQDVVVVRATNGSNPGPFVAIPELIFTCARNLLLGGLANGVEGIAGLGRTLISLPSQFSYAFGFDRKFALCLTNSINGEKGFVLFGETANDLFDSFDYTPLIFNPVSTTSVYFEGEASSDYFIGVTSINISGASVPLDKKLLKIDDKGFGGTMISTVIPYTVMETSIYEAFLNTFTSIYSRGARVPNVAPFDVCYNSTFVRTSQYGEPAVPTVSFILQSSSVVWRISGSNVVVQVEEDVICLAFIDGGQNPRTSIIIGGYQLEGRPVLFDLKTSVFGFVPSLIPISRRPTCADFNFTLSA